MPHGIWKIDGRDVVHLRPDPGGVLFTRFVGDILQPSAHLNGIAASALHFNLRTNKPDGGVDTAVDGALNDRDGWSQCPSAWQFKSSEARDIKPKDLEQEVQKDYAAELIRRGYGYRLCICDELPPEQKKAWETALLAGAKSVTTSPVTPLVLATSDLAAWASNLPSVVLGHFQPQLATLAQVFTVWGSSITALYKDVCCGRRVGCNR